MASDRYIEMKRDDELVMLCAKCYLFLGLEFGCNGFCCWKKEFKRICLIFCFPTQSRVIVEGYIINCVYYCIVSIESILCIEIIFRYWTGWSYITNIKDSNLILMALGILERENIKIYHIILVLQYFSSDFQISNHWKL